MKQSINTGYELKEEHFLLNAYNHPERKKKVLRQNFCYLQKIVSITNIALFF